MEIKTYTPLQLKEFIESAQFAEMPVLPISTARAISQIANPRVESTDVIMFIAFEGDIMAGYLGVLPDKIYNNSGRQFKCGWMSCLWVSPAMRGRGIARLLLQHIFKAWNGNIMATEFTPEAKKLYGSSGHFDDFSALSGLNCYLRFNLHEVLPKKNPKYLRLGSLLRLADLLANIPNSLRLNVMKRQYTFKAQFKRIYKIDDAVNKFITANQDSSFERRGVKELNWIMEMPWIKQSEPTAESKRYHFSSVAARFENLCLKMEVDGKLVGIILLTIRDNRVKVPYAYLEDEYVQDAVEYIYKTMYDYRTNMLTLFHPKLATYITQHRSPFIYVRRIIRQYLMSKTLSPEFASPEKLDIQDGDGDCAFT